MLSRELVELLRSGFALDWNGIHGVSHWSRVRVNGLRLAHTTGANPRVVECFAFLHDSRRVDDGFDPDHGARAAVLAGELCGAVINLSGRELDLLQDAGTHHSGGRTRGDVTVLTCWDADRLDLGRVGARPDPDRLCTDAARDPAVIEWAYRRSLQQDVGSGL